MPRFRQARASPVGNGGAAVYKGLTIPDDCSRLSKCSVCNHLPPGSMPQCCRIGSPTWQKAAL